MRRRNFIAWLGGAIAWPFAARTQQSGRTYRLAFVHQMLPVTRLTKTEGKHYRVFFEELERQGFVEGKNLIVERYSAEGRFDRQTELPREVLPTKPDLIFANSYTTALPFKSATTTIPIVGIFADPTVGGVVTNLARPEGNVTGVSIDAGVEIWGKRFELLKLAVPTVSRIAFLTRRPLWEDPNPRYLTLLRRSADRTGISLVGAPVDDPSGKEQYQRAFTELAGKEVHAIVVSDATPNFINRHVIVELAKQHRLPALYCHREAVEVGGLMAYAFDITEIFRHVALQISQILRGAMPGEIPVYQATKFDLVLNLKTAKELGVTFPLSLLVYASEVIE